MYYFLAKYTYLPTSDHPIPRRDIGTMTYVSGYKTTFHYI